MELVNRSDISIFHYLVDAKMEYIQVFNRKLEHERGFRLWGHALFPSGEAIVGELRYINPGQLKYLAYDIADAIAQRSASCFRCVSDIVIDQIWTGGGIPLDEEVLVKSTAQFIAENNGHALGTLRVETSGPGGKKYYVFEVEFECEPTNPPCFTPYQPSIPTILPST